VDGGGEEGGEGGGRGVGMGAGKAGEGVDGDKGAGDTGLELEGGSKV